MSNLLEVKHLKKYFKTNRGMLHGSLGDALIGADAFLGFSAIALGLVIWLAVLLVKDPQGKVRAAIKRK